MSTKSVTNHNGQKFKLKNLKKLYKKHLKAKNSALLLTLLKISTDRLKNKFKISFPMLSMIKKYSVRISGAIFPQLLNKSSIKRKIQLWVYIKN